VGAVALTGGFLVEEDVLPGRSRAYEALGLNGDGAPMPDVEPGPRVDGSLVSRARGDVEVGWSISYPPGHGSGDALPVALVLHGASGDHTTAVTQLGIDRFLALAVRDGVRPFAVASADGGSTYWRPQPDGTDASRMLVDEFLPLLSRRGLDTATLALTGWSMGGYGALRLVGESLVDAKAVAVMSPALTADDGVLDHPERLGEVPLRIDCGRGDPFYRVVREFVSSLADVDPPPVTTFVAGGHTRPYWRTVAPAQLRFAGERLA